MSPCGLLLLLLLHSSFLLIECWPVRESQLQDSWPPDGLPLCPQCLECLAIGRYSGNIFSWANEWISEQTKFWQSLYSFREHLQRFSNNSSFGLPTIAKTSHWIRVMDPPVTPDPRILLSGIHGAFHESPASESNLIQASTYLPAHPYSPKPWNQKYLTWTSSIFLSLKWGRELHIQMLWLSGGCSPKFSSSGNKQKKTHSAVQNNVKLWVSEDLPEGKEGYFLSLGFFFIEVDSIVERLDKITCKRGSRRIPVTWKALRKCLWNWIETPFSGSTSILTQGRGDRKLQQRKWGGIEKRDEEDHSAKQYTVAREAQLVLHPHK